MRKLMSEEQESITKILDIRVNLVKMETRILPSLSASAQQAISDDKSKNMRQSLRAWTIMSMQSLLLRL